MAAGLATGLALAACSDASGPGSSVTVKPVAASVQISAGDQQTAPALSAVPIAPSVIVKDLAGRPVPDVAVAFGVATGGGSVQNPSAITNAQGIASSGNWTLGTSGENTLVATVGSLVPVTFTATGTPATSVPSPGAFNITLRYLGGIASRQEQAVINAVARWQTVITANLASVPLNAPAASCFDTQPAISELVDDVMIFIEFVDIDGAGNVLGEAGPCYIRSDTHLPIIGHLKLDAADLQLMERTGTLDDVVLHEMGHVLGIGTLWVDKSLLTGAGTDDPQFTGVAAAAAYHTLGGVDAKVPVENTGSAGTRDGHWRESVFGNELMTGYISGTPNPMSILTVESLRDLGYGTNPGAANGYTLSPTSGSIQGGLDLHNHERVVRPRFRVDRHGNRTKIDR